MPRLPRRMLSAPFVTIARGSSRNVAFALVRLPGSGHANVGAPARRTPGRPGRRPSGGGERGAVPAVGRRGDPATVGADAVLRLGRRLRGLVADAGARGPTAGVVGPRRRSAGRGDGGPAAGARCRVAAA